MKDFGFMNSRCLYLEIGQSSLQVLNGSDGLELRLERLENGRLTGACKERLTLSLQGFLKRKSCTGSCYCRLNASFLCCRTHWPGVTGGSAIRNCHEPAPA